MRNEAFENVVFSQSKIRGDTATSQICTELTERLAGLQKVKYAENVYNCKQKFFLKKYNLNLFYFFNRKRNLFKDKQ